MLTPMEIQQKTFAKSFKGYNEEDVDNFMEEVIAAYGNLYRNNAELKEKIDKLSEDMRSNSALEESLKRTLITAQSTSEEMINEASHKADIIVQEARDEYEKIVERARETLSISQRNSEEMISDSNRRAEEIIKSAEMENSKITERAQKTLELAQKAADEAINNANKKSRDLIQEAKEENERILKRGRLELLDIRDQYNQIKKEVTEYKERCQMLAKSQLEALESYSTFPKEEKTNDIKVKQLELLKKDQNF